MTESPVQVKCEALPVNVVIDFVPSDEATTAWPELLKRWPWWRASLFFMHFAEHDHLLSSGECELVFIRFQNPDDVVTRNTALSALAAQKAVPISFPVFQEVFVSGLLERLLQDTLKDCPPYFAILGSRVHSFEDGITEETNFQVSLYEAKEPEVLMWKKKRGKWKTWHLDQRPSDSDFGPCTVVGIRWT